MRKAVIVISSHVARGSVGNRAAVFALEILSYPVWAIPTILLPWHPGHGPSTRIVAPEESFAAFMQDIAIAPWKSEVGAVLSGYMATPNQAVQVAGLVNSLKQENPELVYLCDPVIGDIGGLYVQPETAATIRENLLPLADISTPNRFELGWLVGSATPETCQETLQLANLLAPATVLTTSSPGPEKGTMGNLLKDKSGNWISAHESLDNPPNGPGDLTAAVFLGHHLSGQTPAENLKVTTASILEILKQSARRGSDELTLESDSHSILNPKQSAPVLPV